MKRFVLLLAVFCCAWPVWAAKPLYAYSRVGNADDVMRQTTPATVLMGGGTDVDAAFQWLCQHGGDGDFLVIRATGTEAYNPYIQQLCPNANSVATLIIPSREAAASAFVLNAIQKAEVLWIAGGDQSDYVNYWKGTALQDVLNARIAAGVPIGGTSAGLYVLTQFMYAALENKGVTSKQALDNPFSRYITLDRDFVQMPLLAAVLGDSHVVTRDRMGRDLAFLCRVYANGWSVRPRGIAVDEQTALLIDESSGLASVVGNSTAYFLQAPGAPEVCQAKTPLTYRDIAAYRVRAGDVFDLLNWAGAGGVAYTLSAENGVLVSTQPGGSAY